MREARMYNTRMGIFRKFTSITTLGAVDYRTSRDKARRAGAVESRANAALARSEIANRRRESRADARLKRQLRRNAKRGSTNGG